MSALIGTDLAEALRVIWSVQGSLDGPQELRTAAGIYLEQPMDQVTAVPLTDSLTHLEQVTVAGASSWGASNWKNNGWGRGSEYPEPARDEGNIVIDELVVIEDTTADNVDVISIAISRPDSTGTEVLIGLLVLATNPNRIAINATVNVMDLSYSSNPNRPNMVTPLPFLFRVGDRLTCNAHTDAGGGAVLDFRFGYRRTRDFLTPA